MDPFNLNPGPQLCRRGPTSLTLTSDRHLTSDLPVTPVGDAEDVFVGEGTFSSFSPVLGNTALFIIYCKFTPARTSHQLEAIDRIKIYSIHFSSAKTATNKLTYYGFKGLMVPAGVLGLLSTLFRLPKMSPFRIRLRQSNGRRSIWSESNPHLEKWSALNPD